MSRLTFDAVIVGGGIAGLWTLNRLCNRGYNAILLEDRALGSFQTIASQGMIHGGIKYTLGGALSGASEAIADMPDHWRACLRGEGDVDLRGARILSDHFYLWSTAGITSRFSGFLASKATRGRVEKVAKSELPPLFPANAFQGTLYRLVDMVMDTTSVLAALAENYRSRIFQVDWTRCSWQDGGTGEHSLAIDGLAIDGGDGPLTITAPAFVFCAGKGNGPLLEAVGARAPAMQLRPLHQVMVHHRLPHPFFGHCVAADKTPRLTISSHPLGEDGQVWYLGGSLAEKGVARSPREQIEAARRELATLMPWLDLSDGRWATLRIDRAEPRQHNLVRPDRAFAEWASGPANVIAAWPTKLTLSPHMAMEVERLLGERGVAASGLMPPQLPLPAPPLSPTPWQEAFDHAA